MLITTELRIGNMRSVASKIPHWSGVYMEYELPMIRKWPTHARADLLSDAPPYMHEVRPIQAAR